MSKLEIMEKEDGTYLSIQGKRYSAMILLGYSEMAHNAILELTAIRKMELHDFCVVVVNKMIADNVKKHISFISPEDDIDFGMKEGGKIPKVTIEWVDASEAKNGKISQKETVAAAFLSAHPEETK